MKVTGYASDKDCRSPADNDKDHIKSELLFARQPDLAAAHTPVPFPLILSTETASRSCRNLIFFPENDRKRANDKLQTVYTVKVKPDLQPLYGYLVGRGEPDERAPSSFPL